MRWHSLAAGPISESYSPVWTQGAKVRVGAVLNDRTQARQAYRQALKAASETERLAARLDLNAALARFPRSRAVQDAASWVPAGK